MTFIAPALGGLGSFLGTAAVGLATTALTYGLMGSMGGGGQSAGQSSLLNMQQQGNTVLDDLPEAPEAPTNDPADDSAAEQARQEQLKAMAAAEQRNNVNPTGGLGVTGAPATAKKQLLGS